MTTEDIYKHYSMSAAAVDVASLSTRSLYCPECHFKIQEVYDDCRKGHIQAKCRKCKKIVVFDLALFRTVHTSYSTGYYSYYF